MLKNDVLPKDREPFKGLITDEGFPRFTAFISTPVITSITYGPISIIIEENRYQITDNRFEDPPSSPVILITKKYFGELLRHTPFQLGGINLNGAIQFTGIQNEHAFDEKLGIKREVLCEVIGASDIRISVDFSFPWKNGML